MARQSKSILRGALQLAVMSSVLSANPVRDVQPLRSKSQPKGAVALTADQLRDLLVNIQTSSFCEKHDLVDPITLLIATGLRRSELGGSARTPRPLGPLGAERARRHRRGRGRAVPAIRTH
jgi:integrase